MTKLAIDGGTPVRDQPLPPNYPGAVMYGQEEGEAMEAIARAQSPFRYYGPDLQYKVRQLETAMKQKLGIEYALGVSSCTAALITALKALGIGYGDKVIVPAVTFIATAGAVLCCNAVPVFADVDESLNLDPHDLERVMDDEVKAIIAVPILGNPCDMDPIMAFARRKGIPVIEDVAQSIGVSYQGKYQGTIGDVGVFSFQMNKIITSGEGGALVTSQSAIFERAVRYHDQGLFREAEFHGLIPSGGAMNGQNYRMSELTGAAIVEQWKKLDGILQRMRASHQAIKESVHQRLPALAFRHCPDPAGDIGSNLGIILPSAEVANAFMRAMNAENVNTVLLYGGKPVYAFPQFIDKQTGEKDHFPYNYPFRHPVHYSPTMCPKACDLIARTAFIPVSPLLTARDVEQISDGIVKVYKSIVPSGGEE